MVDDRSLTILPGASLRSLTIAAMRKEISEGRMAPGMRLVERELCDALGVSRTVIREALRHLEAQGYVTNVPRQGPIVALLDHDTLRSIYEVLETIETRAAAAFVQRSSKADRDFMQSCWADLVALEKDANPITVVPAVESFTSSIITGSGNTLFGSIIAPLTGRVHVLTVRAARSAERRPKAYRQLKALARALLGADPEAAARAARTRIVSAAEFALREHGER